MLLERDGVNAFNDIQPDADGPRLRRRDPFDLERPQGREGAGRVLPDRPRRRCRGALRRRRGVQRHRPLPRRCARCTTSTPRRRASGSHDVAADGSVSNRRHIGRAAFERGIPDGMCVDADGNLWVAHVGGRRVVKLSPTGDELDQIPVPAKAVTSVAFGGPDLPTCTSSPPTTSTTPRPARVRVPLPARRGRPAHPTRHGSDPPLTAWRGARRRPPRRRSSDR